MKPMTGDMLSQEEIDALLKGDDNSNDMKDDVTSGISVNLTEEDKDTLGEIGNISMGTAATTLFTLLGHKVIITTPQVSMTNIEELAIQYPIPFVAVDVRYKLGLEGANLLILKADDVKVITDLMMGGDGTDIDREINDMDLSAISEAMNQMVGSSSTSLSEMFMNTIDIEPPRAFKVNFYKGDWDFKFFGADEPIVKISFKMEVGNVIDSEIMQLIPYDFAKSMVDKVVIHKEDEIAADALAAKTNIPKDHESRTNLQEAEINKVNSEKNYEDQYNEPQIRSINNLRSNPKKEPEIPTQEPVNVEKVEFESFDNNDDNMYNESIERIQDIPVEITVELGRTVKKISEILEYGSGTVVELDKLVGEPLEIYANGKFIARGEVVVIDENFGIRVTDIINPTKRISKL